MTPGVYPISIQRGASLTLDFPVTNSDGTAWDLTGFSSKMRFYDDDRNVVRAADATEGVVTSDTRLTVHASKAVGDVTTGTVELRLAPTDTVALVPGTQLRYQLDLIDQAGDVNRLLVGEVVVHEGIEAT